MKVMWVTSIFIGEMAKQFKIKQISGQWQHATLESEINSSGNQLVVYTSSKKPFEIKQNNVGYYALGHGYAPNYKVNKKNISVWKEILNKEKPDVLLIWGTEYEISRCCLIANEHRVPAIIYIQGIMSTIVNNYRGGLSDDIIAEYATLLEKIKKRTIFDIEKQYMLCAAREKQMLELADAVIIDNEWAKCEIKKINPSLKIYWNRLAIKHTFTQYTWSEEKSNNYQLLTTASVYPLKGFHVLLKALAIVKEKYPNTKLLAPGYSNSNDENLITRIRQSGYVRYIKRMIIDYKLTDNIEFIGILSSDQYAARMIESKMFICTSAIENHSSTLREAMSVGVPCISTDSGGIPCFGVDHVNCSLYEFENYERLAKHIIELLESKDLRLRYSLNGKKTIKRLYTQQPLKKMSEIYELLISET